MSVAQSLPDEQSIASALERDLRAWLRDQRADWDKTVLAADSSTLGGDGDLWDDMPALDSKVVARSSHIFKEHLGIALDAKLIRPGGYNDDDDAVLDLIPRMIAAAANPSKRKKGDKVMSDDAARVALGARLKTAREYRGFSQEEVAKFLGLPRSAISLIESGGRGLDVLEAKKLTELFECTGEELTGEQARQAPDPDTVGLVARAAASLSPEDRSEVLRFAQFLQSRKGPQES